MNCEYHLDRPAAGTCVECGKRVCPECKVVVEGKIYCNSCVERWLTPGTAVAHPTPGTVYSANTSGLGSRAIVPPDLGDFNWGAFLLTWIWGIGNNVWISLLALLGILPYIGWIAQIAMAIILGLRGSEWAWQSKRWENLEHFRKTQRSWMWWGIGVLIFQVIAVTLLVTLVIVALIVVGALSYNDGFQWNYEPPDWW